MVIEIYHQKKIIYSTNKDTNRRKGILEKILTCSRKNIQDHFLVAMETSLGVHVATSILGNRWKSLDTYFSLSELKQEYKF